MKHILLLILIFVVASASSVLTLAGVQTQNGERAFKQRCAGCHSLAEGKNLAGPSLYNIIGQMAGSRATARYSDALKQSGLIWDEDTLDRYLSDPGKLVPGTRMMIKIQNPELRAQIIRYLAGVAGDA